jgi:hypothetical protein
MLLIVLVALFVCVLVSGLVYFSVHARKLRAASWDDLLSQLQPVSRQGVTAVALDNLQPKASQLQLEPAEMWQMLGGGEGFERMRKNATVLLELAGWVQRWNYEEAAIVVERMRRDASQLRRAIFRIQLAMVLTMLLRSRALRVPFSIHEAATSYYLMTARLLALYETSHAGLLPRLAEAL